MENLTKLLDYLSRKYLDNYDGLISDTLSSNDTYIPNKDSLQFLHIYEITRSWKEVDTERKKDTTEKNGIYSGYRTGGILTSCVGSTTPVVFLVEGNGSRVSVNIGTCTPLLKTEKGWNADNAKLVIEKSLSSGFPGIHISTKQLLTPGFSWPNQKPEFFGLVTGTPSYKENTENQITTQMDLLIRSMSGWQWGFMIIAQPLKEKHASTLAYQLIDEIDTIKDAVDSKAIHEKLAKTYIERLDIKLKELQDSLNSGLWTTSMYYYASERTAFNCLGASLRGCFSGKHSFPDPIRTIEYPALENIIYSFGQPLQRLDSFSSNFEYPYRFQTLLSSNQLSSILHLPRVEMPGYPVRDLIHTDVAVHHDRKKATIRLGDVLDYGKEVGNDYPLSPAMLNKHTLIIGVTGSGKSYTSRYLLKQLWQQNIPFLVIEPAKKEYRDLLKDPDIGKDLAVFTLGNELETPFRLNPFECEPHVPISSHIDLLKSVFNAAFSMWTVLPQILEQSLHEVYENYGWNIVRNTNRRLKEGKIDRREAFPTLTDLQQTISIVVDRLAYSDDSTKELKAALITRIRSLRIGGKGKMLDTRESFPMERLLAKPIIFELEDIGDDDEKAFIMALLLSKIYEHLRGRKESKSLKGIVVVEEAHRLLSNIHQQSNAEVSNTKGKAVETFVNMLSEVRAYGQGFMIAEQIPSKLAPDVIKNTNVKIIQRTVAGDDRELIGQAINLDNKKNNVFALLTVGQAIVFSEGDDRPIMVAVDNREKNATPVSTKSSNSSAVNIKAQITDRFPEITYDCLAHCKQYIPEKSFDCDLAQEIAEKEEIQKIFSYYLLSILEEPHCIIDELTNVLAQIDRYRSGLTKDNDMTKSILIHGIYYHLRVLGNLYRWSFNGIDKLVKLIIPVVLDVLIATLTNNEESLDNIHDNEQLRTYREKYIKLCERQFDSFPFCENICDKEPKSCLYRYQTQTLINDKNLDYYFMQSLDNSENDEIMTANFNQLGKDTSSQCASEMIPVESQWKIGRCFIMQKMDNLADRPIVERNEILKKLVHSYRLKANTLKS